MRLLICLFFIIAAAASAFEAPRAGDVDDSLKIYAARVKKSPPFKKPFVGYGIYLGRGAVISAAHVVGRWPFFTDPRVLIAGQDLSATIISKGNADDLDVTLVSVDETRLPISLRMRRNPLCKDPPRVGEDVLVVNPDGITHSQVISPLLVDPQYRVKYDTLLTDVVGSGSGIFRPGKKCLLGIGSKQLPKYAYREENGSLVEVDDGYAGYFVPASQIAEFIPPEFRF
jgi:hypothetical protein